MYWVARRSKLPSAPIQPSRTGEAKNRKLPTIRPCRTTIRQAQVKMLLASSGFFSPRRTEMGTAEPTPMRSEIAKLMMTSGMARLSAAKASPPSSCPTNMPSSSWYSEDASMPTEPGSAALKNRRVGLVLRNSSFCVIFPFPPYL